MKKPFSAFKAWGLAVALAASCVGAQAQMQLTSPAFQAGQTIPNPFTNNLGAQCTGSNQSPPLEISGIPSDTQTLVITMIDTSAGNFLHWKVWDIAVAPGVTTASLGANAATTFPTGNQSVNDFGTGGYGGACPPPAGTPGLPDTHNYVFTVYALTTAPGGGQPTAATLAAVPADHRATLLGTRAQADNVAWPATPNPGAPGASVMAVPTLSEVSLVLMGLILAGGAAVRQRRRRT